MNSLNGYPIVYMPKHHRCLTNGFVYEHILVAERKLGRELYADEVVHHIDFNRANNDPANLLIFASNSDHVRFHAHNCEQYILDEFGVAHCTKEMYPPIGRIITFVNCYDEEETIIVGDCCELCGEPIVTKGSRFCKECSQLYVSSMSSKPSRDDVKYMIRNNSFESIGREFNVTSKSIARWCKSYGLPYKKKDIKSLSDKDWEFI